jgi:hypothetical protein
LTFVFCTAIAVAAVAYFPCNAGEIQEANWPQFRGVDATPYMADGLLSVSSGYVLEKTKSQRIDFP